MKNPDTSDKQNGELEKGKITISDNKPMNYAEEKRDDFSIAYNHEIPFSGKKKITLSSFGDMNVSYNGITYAVKKIKINRKKHFIQVTDIEGADKEIIKEIKKCTRKENGLPFKINPYYVSNSDSVTIKYKKDGSVKSMKVTIEGKKYKVKKNEWNISEAKDRVVFKGENVAGYYDI